jgi:hypothetical protein
MISVRICRRTHIFLIALSLAASIVASPLASAATDAQFNRGTATVLIFLRALGLDKIFTPADISFFLRSRLRPAAPLSPYVPPRNFRRGGGGNGGGNRTEETGNRSSNFTASTIAPTLGGFSNITKTFGDDPFTLTAPTSNSDGTFSYQSGNTGIATVSGNIVTLVAVGTTTITATQAASGNYTSGTRTLTLTVGPGYCELNANPCLHGGTCSNDTEFDSFFCSCPDPYSGDTCQKSDTSCAADSEAQCLNGGTCVPDTSGGQCECPACFEGDKCETYVCAA